MIPHFITKEIAEVITKEKVRAFKAEGIDISYKEAFDSVTKDRVLTDKTTGCFYGTASNISYPITIPTEV